MRIAAGQQGAFDWRASAVALATGASGVAGSVTANLIANNGQFDPTRFAIDMAGNVLTSRAAQAGTARNKMAETKPGAKAEPGRAVVMRGLLDDAVLKSARELYNKDPANTALYRQRVDANGASTLSLLAGRERSLENGKLMLVGHGGDSEGFAADIGSLAAALRTQGVQNLAKTALIACNAGAGGDSSLLRSAFDAMKRNGIVTSVSGHGGQVQVDAAGRRIADSVASMTFTLSAQGALAVSPSRNVGAALSSGWLGSVTRGRGGPMREFDNAASFDLATRSPEPNATYRYGNYTFRTDANARVVRASGPVQVQAYGRRTTDGITTTAIGRGPDARPGDVGFHLFGDQFGGPINFLNVVPGNGIGRAPNGASNLNTGAYRMQFENPLRRQAENGSRIPEAVIFPEYQASNGTTRPDTFVTLFNDNDNEMNSTLFRNQAGG